MIEPISPFSGKPFAETGDRERDVWVYKLLNSKSSVFKYCNQWFSGDMDVLITIPLYTQGECLSELLESKLWPDCSSLTRVGNKHLATIHGKEFTHEMYQATASVPGAAVVEAVIRANWARSEQ